MSITSINWKKKNLKLQAQNSLQAAELDPGLEAGCAPLPSLGFF